MLLRENGNAFNFDIRAHWQLLNGDATYTPISLNTVAVK